MNMEVSIHLATKYIDELLSNYGFDLVGRGYVPFETTDIAAGSWSISANYTLPSRPRHGSVIPMYVMKSGLKMELTGTPF